MYKTIKNLVYSSILVFGLIYAQTGFKGELSTDLSVTQEPGETTSISSAYTGISLFGDNWEISANLAEGAFNVEEAKYFLAMSDAIKVTFGSQAEPYGLAWGLHRPSNNAWVSAPREHSIMDGIGVEANAWGVGIQTLYGSDNYWAARASYGILDHTIGVSLNSNEAQLVDLSGTVSMLGIPVENSLEYDLANDGAYWLRSVITPEVAKGAYALLGYNSTEEVSYGLGYNISDNCHISTELSVEGDKLFRLSHSF